MEDLKLHFSLLYLSLAHYITVSIIALQFEKKTFKYSVFSLYGKILNLKTDYPRSYIDLNLA
jgi:hypothetical protein